MVYKYEEPNPQDEAEVCPCCGMKLKGEQLPITCSLESLYHLGSGNALYFSFVKCSIYLLLLMFIICGAFNLLSNVISGDCLNEAAATATDTTNICTADFRLILSLANKRDDSSLISIQIWLNLAFIFVMMPFFHYIRYKHRRINSQVEKTSLTPADFTVQLSNLPLDATDEEILEWIESFSISRKPIRVRKIIRAYQIKDFIKSEARKDELLKKLKSDISHTTRAVIISELDQIDFEREERLNNQKEKYTKVAYVIFEKIQMAELICDIFQKSPFRAFLYRIFPCAKRIKLSKDQDVKIIRAPEPKDILWTNHAFTKLRRIKNRIYTSLATLVFLIIASVLYILIYNAQRVVDNQIGEDFVLNEFSSILASLIICIINIILSYLIEWLVGFEKYKTKTTYYTKMAEKKSIALLINTAFTSLVAQLILANGFNTTVSDVSTLNVYGEGGLIENMFYTIILNAIYAPLLSYFSVEYFYTLCRRKYALWKGPKAIMTQAEANTLFEAPHHHMPYKYSNLIKTMLLTSFYAPAMPIAILISIIGLVVTYWVDKYLLLRRNSFPVPLNNQLSDSMLEYLEWMAFTFSAGNVLFTYTLVNSEGEKVYTGFHEVAVWFTMGISVIYALMPMDIFNETWFPIQKKKDKNLAMKSFDEARLGFHTDYDVQNPITRQEAVEELIMNAKKHKKSQWKLEKMFKDERVSQLFGVMVEKAALGEEEEAGTLAVSVDYRDRPVVSFRPSYRPPQVAQIQSDEEEDEIAKIPKVNHHPQN